MAVLLPVIVVVLMWLTNSPKLIGEPANGWGVKGVMAFIVMAVAYLTSTNGAALLARAFGR